MDLTALSPGTRAAVSNILSRGLASLPARQRDPLTVAAVQGLQTHLRRLTTAETDGNQILALLALNPNGLRVARQETLQQIYRLHRNGLAEQVTLDGSKWRITRPGWEQLWICGLAQELVNATGVLLHAELCSLEWA